MFWYTREKGKDQAEQARLELQAIKQREEDLMAEVCLRTTEWVPKLAIVLQLGRSCLLSTHRKMFASQAMGLKPKTIKLNTKPKLSAQDMAKINGPVESEDPAQPDPLQDPDAVKGLGYAP